MEHDLKLHGLFTGIMVANWTDAELDTLEMLFGPEFAELDR